MTNFELINLLKDCSVALRIPILLINNENKIMDHFPDTFRKPPEVLRDLHNTYIEESRKFPYTLQLMKDPYEAHMLLYPVTNEQGDQLVIGAGPFLQQEVERKHIHFNLIRNGLSTDWEEELVDYFEQLPVINQVQISAIESMLKRILPRDESKEKQEEMDRKLRRQYQEYTTSLHSYPDVTDSRQRIIELFEKGDEQCLEAYHLHMEKYASHIKEDIRKYKNHIIRLVSEISYLCVDNGATRGEVYSLGDFYIHFLETKTTIEELHSLESIVIKSFLDRVRSIKQQLHSPLVDRSQRYIFQNLTSDLTLKKIADSLNVNPNYLSGVFTKEMGVSITQFINQQRIKEAKELLSISHHSLMDISLLLGYNSQSYFTRVFKSIEGIGPKEFRQKYSVKEG
ncbi:AraC family transcriptional regulator [Halobacillus litoralis]|uniref:AraC family transcriptional regulator n=1 Tax=Halobacillus litoralis TaxID=45668 RepID=UPI001CFD8329|nr:AraC family transcriptional regulator [Halobacillus litoralis]